MESRRRIALIACPYWSRSEHGVDSRCYKFTGSGRNLAYERLIKRRFAPMEIGRETGNRSLHEGAPVNLFLVGIERMCFFFCLLGLRCGLSALLGGRFWHRLVSMATSGAGLLS